MVQKDEIVKHSLMQESMILKDIENRKRHNNNKPVIGLQKAERTCILTRHNDHKHDIQGNPGQWQMLVDEHESCWVCDAWCYSLVFFNPTKPESKSP